MDRQRRIQKELKDLFENKLEDNGIYCELDNDNINIIKVMMIGTKNTPYENGFFFFTIKFPQNYPFVPLKVWYYTTNPHMRFNPNLYNNGKVCLSIINTWGRTDNWTESMGVKSVLLSIQSMVLNEEPLRNEPGLPVSTESINAYNSVVKYCVFNIAIHEVLTKEFQRKFENNQSDITISFDNFKPIIKEYFIKNINWYLKRTKELHLNFNNKIVKFNKPFAQYRFICNYNYLLDEFTNIYKNLTNKEIDNIKISLNNIDLSKMNVNNLKKICRENKFKGYSKKRKLDIINLINEKSENNEIII